MLRVKVREIAARPLSFVVRPLIWRLRENIPMSTYILMKILESAPSRYDKGIRILTLGRLDDAYNRLTSYIKSGQKVLDLGCGTGTLTLKAAQKSAKVKGIDVNSQMLEIARKRTIKANLTENIELYEMGVAELGSEESESYDVVMSKVIGDVHAERALPMQSLHERPLFPQSKIQFEDLLGFNKLVWEIHQKNGKRSVS